MAQKPTYQELEQQVKDLEKYRDMHGLLRLMADNVPDMIWAKDIEDKYLFANQAICDKLLHSDSTSEPVGKTDMFFARRERESGFDHTFGEICVNSDAVVKKNNRPGRFLEDGLVRGRYLALDVHKAPFYNEKGEMIGTVGCGRDVTQELEMNRRLKESEERFREIIEDVSEIGIQGYDENRRVTFWNKASETIYGYSEAEAHGQALEDLIIPDVMKDDVIRLHRLWLEKGEKIPAGELVLINKYGQDVHVFSSHVMHETAAGKEMFCIDVDLTRIRQSEKEKEHLQSQLRQAQKIEAIGTLAGGIAHDFNNVLSPIMGFAELLIEDLPRDSESRENAQEIFAAGQRGSELVKQILSFSRQSEQKRLPVKFQLILKEVIKLCRSTIPANIDIVQDIQPDFGYVMADATQLHQVVMNLLANAYQALEHNSGRISIELKKMALDAVGASILSIPQGAYAMLVVSDTGVGIPPEHMDKIFDPYFTTKESGKGTGLGLATLYGIVKDHQGEIRVHSVPGTGTTFKIYLPLMEEAPLTQAAGKPPAYPKGNERILLVDDDASVARVETQLLARLGYRVTRKTSSLEALDTFKADPEGFDVVITDMAMPKKTGAQLAREILEIRQEMPVILCTGYSDRIDADTAKKIGVKGFLLKPVTYSGLAQAVRKLLDQG